jgi:TATA-box binding protein (TBP) (component of TFIID and TFIIIB)
MVEPKIVLLIFVSGKVVLTGGKVRLLSWYIIRFPSFFL